MKLRWAVVVVVACGAFAGESASAAMMITEWAYQGSGGEFVEFTNTGTSAIDMTGWSFDDNSGIAGSVSLSGFGLVAPGESVVLTDLTATTFRTEWGLSTSAKVIGDNLQNLGRSDEINLYDSVGTRMDWLTYDDQAIGGPRTNLASANPGSLAALGAHDVLQWLLSTRGDMFLSYTSASGGVGNPGLFALAPEPGSAMLVVLAGSGLLFASRRRRSG